MPYKRNFNWLLCAQVAYKQQCWDSETAPRTSTKEVILPLLEVLAENSEKSKKSLHLCVALSPIHSRRIYYSIVRVMQQVDVKWTTQIKESRAFV